MKLKNIMSIPFVKDFSRMLFFGVLSYMLGLVKFSIPGYEGAISDLREIPLIISVFHLSNPLYMIGVSLITALGTPPDGSYFSTFLMHSVALIISWFFYNYIKKTHLSFSRIGFIWVIFIIIYYLCFLIPILIITQNISGINPEISFFFFYRDLLFSVRFELVTSAIITALYLVQNRMFKKIKAQKSSLEILVKERTEELETANEELISVNEELFDKNSVIELQNSKLNITLQHLKETQSQLLQSEKMSSLGILTAGVAHEINNPLNYIMGAYIGLKNYFLEFPPVKSERIYTLLSCIDEGVDRASKIVVGLNQFSRNSENNDENCNIHSIIDNCLAMLNNQLENRIAIQKSYFEKELYVLGNTGKLHQVFLNILTNAIQSIENDGSISISTHILSKEGVIKISDTGVGIVKEDITKLTVPFYTTKDPGKGTGLGLSISYNIIKEHSGKISFKSEVGKGTIVSISLPLNH